MEYANRRLQIPAGGRYYVYLTLFLILVFYLFYPSPPKYVPSSSKYVPSAHLEGGEPWAQYCTKDQGMSFIICVILTFVLTILQQNTYCNSSFETHKY